MYLAFYCKFSMTCHVGVNVTNYCNINITISPAVSCYNGQCVRLEFVSFGSLIALAKTIYILVQSEALTEILISTLWKKNLIPKSVMCVMNWFINC